MAKAENTMLRNALSLYLCNSQREHKLMYDTQNLGSVTADTQKNFTGLNLLVLDNDCRGRDTVYIVSFFPAEYSKRRKP